MDTLLIQLTNNRAYKLLQELEELHLIKVLKKDIKPSALEKSQPIRKKASDYKGLISPELGERMQEYIKKSREEWQHRI